MRTSGTFIAFRTDSSETLGAGHVVRCVALAYRLKALGADTLFICRPHRGHLVDFIRAEGFRVTMLPAPAENAPGTLGATATDDAKQTRLALHQLMPDWLVVDHYGADEQWEQLVAQPPMRLAAIDDLANRRHSADLLIDPGLQSSEGRYAGLLPAHARQLLGPRYALLRPKFADLATSVGPRNGRIHGIAASAGGTDPKGMLETVVAAWRGLGPDRPELNLLIGATSPNLDRLQRLCRDLSGVKLHIQSERLVEILADADLAVVAGGGMNWERCCLGLPAIIIPTASNQAQNVAALTRRRTAVTAGDVTTLQPTQLRDLLTRLIARPSLVRRMAARSRGLVDGLGALRCAVAMLVDELVLSDATPDDADTVLPWRNAPSTRQHFHDPDPIDSSAHHRWWTATLANPSRWLAIASIGHQRVGVLRLDADEDQAVVSVYLDPALTGLGLGPRLLTQAALHGPQRFPQLRYLRAEIHAGNFRSRAAFREAGYTDMGEHWQLELR